uniref:Uncharacterized protein n=1 Tax=Cacopsylla melanoneura TaxID=428564 RepID=A0A8D8RB99_9HEMI
MIYMIVSSLKQNSDQATSSTSSSNQTQSLPQTEYWGSEKSCNNEATSIPNPECNKRDMSVQTEIDMTGWANLMNGLMNKICEQETIIEDLENQVKTLESLLQNTLLPDTQTKDSPSTLLPSVEIKQTSRSKNVPKTQTKPKSGKPNENETLNIVKTDVIRKCNVIGDSHCRGLGYHMRRYVDRVETMFKPGSGFVGIKDSSTMSMSNLAPEDKVVYFCGTNDVQDRNWDEAFSSVDYIMSKYKPSQLCFVLVPIRWDKPYLNKYVQQFNNKLRDKLKSKSVSYLDPNYSLRPWHYARDGMHLNTNGKRLLCLKLKNHLVRVAELSCHPMTESREIGTGGNETDGHVVDRNNSCYVPTDMTCEPHTRDDSTPHLHNTRVNRSLGNSFALDQSYMYDMGHLSLLNNTSVQTPNITNMSHFPTLPVTTPITIDLSGDSTFTITPQRHKKV